MIIEMNLNEKNNSKKLDHINFSKMKKFHYQENTYFSSPLIMLFNLFDILEYLAP